jgi:hypothetical protein
LAAARVGPAAAEQRVAALQPGVVGLGVPRQWFGRPAGEPEKRAWQLRKSPRTAFASSLLVPGLGQLYNEREFWALVAAGVQFYYLGNIVIEQRLTNRYRNAVNADPSDREVRVLFELHRDNRIQSTWLYALAALVSGLQSMVDAHLHDFDDSPLPLQVGPLPGGGGLQAAVQLGF